MAVFYTQKADNLLNLALDATPLEREKSDELDVGFEPDTDQWDLIIKYSGGLDRIRELGATAVEVGPEYAIVTINSSDIERLAALPEVEYIEKPKRLFFQIDVGVQNSCIPRVWEAPTSLSGSGVLVAIIDSGIQYQNRDFLTLEGQSRIRYLWDQTIPGNPPAGYTIGTEYTREQINQALAEPSISSQLSIVPSVDVSGHGTAVAAIAAGNGANSRGNYRGVAFDSELLIVKLGNPKTNGFPRTVELMEAVDYAVKKAIELQMPLSINLSFGNTYGAHDGSSLLERFLSEMSNLGRTVISVGTGNEAGTAGHVQGVLGENEKHVQLAIQERQTGFGVQLWKNYVDSVEILITAPSGEWVILNADQPGTARYRLGNTQLLLYYGEPSPYSSDQEIYIDFLPVQTYLDGGLWRITLRPIRIVQGNYELWLPSEQVLNRGTAFLFPSPQTTLTIPSSAARVISVGAYNARTFSYAEFSGRGYTRTTNLVKPDLVAPGVNVTTADTQNGYTTVSGTSFATPFVAGSAALLMEWGIVRGNDPYLYGEKVKAYLRKGAKELPGYSQYPNDQVGFGALCLRNSLPV